MRNTFWMGRGGSITHAISGIDIAMWDILGKATGQPVGRLLGRTVSRAGAPYASVLMREPRALAEQLAAVREQGFRAFKIGWGPFGREQLRDGRSHRARGARGGRPDSLLMVDAGASDAFWPQDYKWAARTAQMLADYDVHWFEEPLPPDNLHDYVLLRRHSPVPIAGGEVLTRRQSFAPWLQAARFRHRAAGRDEGRRHQRGAAHRVDGGGERRAVHPARLEHGAGPGGGSAARVGQPRTRMVEYLTGSPFIDDLVETAVEAGCRRHAGHPGRPRPRRSRSTWTRWRSTRASASDETAADLPRRLGMVDATAIVVGIVIGSGIFVLPNVIARNVPRRTP